MLYLDFDDAWRTYLDAAPRLPPSPAPVTPRRVSGLIEAVERGGHRLVVFDAYGVLHTGDDAIPQALAAFAELRRRGMPVCVVTNDVTHDSAQVAEGLARRGFDFTVGEVISGRSLLPAVLAEHGGGQGFGVIASHPQDVISRFPGLRALPDDPATYDAVDGFLLVDTNAWTATHPTLLEDSLTRRPRPLIVCNPDVGCPFRGRISAEPGYFAHRIAARTGIGPVFLGKPFPAVYQRVLARFPDISPAAMLMVGDSPHTDILGGRGVGMDCLLVECGFLSGRDSLAACAESGLWPDYVAETP